MYKPYIPDKSCKIKTGNKNTFMETLKTMLIGTGKI